ncbi:MAG: phage tail tape measure protein [Brevundimonas sp.]|uniref:phage tail tape measure protein n=1 Tax=Brevundimonas sp. TaxID=1871086 RepID=UPI00391B0729
MDKKLRLDLIFRAAGNVKGFLGGMRSDADKTGKALAGARQRVQELQRASKDVTAFRALQGGLSGTREKIAAARSEVGRLGAAMDATTNPTRAMARGFDVAKTRLRELETQQGKQVARLTELKGKLEAAGVSTEALGAHERGLARDLQKANVELAEQSRRMEQVADRQARMRSARGRYDRTQQMAGSMQGAGFSGMAAGAAVAAPLVAGVKAAMDLESRMTTIAQRSNMSAEATNAFERSILATGRAANRTRDEALNMFDELTAAGFESKAALAMGGDLGRAATAYEIDDRDIAATAGSLRNLHLEAGQTGRALDIMAVAGKRGQFEFKDMAASFPSLTAGVERYGMKGLKAVAEIAAAAQVARRGAGSGEEAATNLGNLLQKIASPETERKFAKLGINLRDGLAAGAKEGKSALETIIEMTQRATGGDKSKLGQLFEDSQVQKALLPLMAHMEEFRRIRDEALGADGEVDRDFARRMEDNAQAVKSLHNEAGAASIRLGRDLMPAVTAVTGAVTGVLGAYNSWASVNPGVAKGVAVVGASIAAVAVAGGALALVVSAVLGPWALMRFAIAGALPYLGAMAGGIATASGAVWAFTAALLANPVTWVVLAVVALAAAALLIYRNWGPISAWFGQLWQGIRTAASSALGFLGRMFMNFSPVGILVGAIMRAWPALQALGGRFMQLGRHLLSGLVNGVLGGIPALVRAVMRAGGSVIAGFKQRLGIRSPSRVFAQLGDYTMQGLGVGIGRSARNPLRQMRGAAGALAAAGVVGLNAGAPNVQFEADPRLQAPPAAASAGAGASRAGVSIGNVTIQIIQRPGQSDQDLAREIARVLQSPDLARLGDGSDSWGAN